MARHTSVVSSSLFSANTFLENRNSIQETVLTLAIVEADERIIALGAGICGVGLFFSTAKESRCHLKSSGYHARYTMSRGV